MKLHVGCGSVILDGYVNIDILDSPGVDRIADISNLPFERNSIDEIYSCANLDHFDKHTWKNTLIHWYELLKPNGIIRLSVTDFEAVCEEYNESRDIDSLLGLVLGGHRHKHDCHGMIFDYDYLKKHMEDIGFHNVRRYHWLEIWSDYPDFDDYSKAYLPHMDTSGRLMVLNMEGRK